MPTRKVSFLSVVFPPESVTVNTSEYVPDFVTTILEVATLLPAVTVTGSEGLELMTYEQLGEVTLVQATLLPLSSNMEIVELAVSPTFFVLMESVNVNILLFMLWIK